MLVVGGVGVVTRRLRVPAYDFDHRGLLAARSQRYGEVLEDAVLRIGPIVDYGEVASDLDTRGVRLANTVEHHVRASELTAWYPRIEHLTPTTMVLDEGSVDGLGDRLGWPVFVKGDRQTNRHTADLAIARTPSELQALVRRARKDDILGWQRLVARQHLDLRRVGGVAPGGLPMAFEFRTFWWRGHLLGAGAYWGRGGAFDWSREERRDALEVAGEAAKLVDVPFLVVDVAQDTDGRWWVIECNDAQESSYAGCSAIGIWQRFVALRSGGSP